MPQNIINLANALYSNHLPRQPQHESDDRLDAARALLGVSPSSVSDGPLMLCPGQVGKSLADSGGVVASDVKVQRRSRSDSAGLEALAFLATKEQASRVTSDNIVSNTRRLVASAVSSSSEDEDSEAMPPPPPRIKTRRRSVSNPEGMEKWVPADRSRLHFVLPASILEEELAEASAAMKAKEEKEEVNEDLKEEEEEILSPDELLRRARSRLLEDLSEGNINGEKGVLTLPHSLAKYKDVYNRNGRIGIYTPAERSAIIRRFHSKRTRRVWNKKIRYGCRKNLADRRMRVKGRFVKRSTEAQAKAKAAASAPLSAVPSIPESEEASFVTPESSVVAGEPSKDEEMPDVDDPDAGFCPTDDQPFRRVRRHTIT